MFTKRSPRLSSCLSHFFQRWLTVARLDARDIDSRREQPAAAVGNAARVHRRIEASQVQCVSSRTSSVALSSLRRG